MDVKVRTAGTITIVTFNGKVTIDHTGKMLARFEELLAEGHRLFIFDMLGVPWLDSAAIGQTIGCYRRAKELGGVVKLVLKDKAHDLFTYMELHRVFEIYKSVEEALASFAGEEASTG